jgi:hypothetical protein
VPRVFKVLQVIKVLKAHKVHLVSREQPDLLEHLEPQGSLVLKDHRAHQVSPV